MIVLYLTPPSLLPLLHHAGLIAAPFACAQVDVNSGWSRDESYAPGEFSAKAYRPRRTKVPPRPERNFRFT